MTGPETPDNYQGIFDSLFEEACNEETKDPNVNVLDYVCEKLEELDIHRIDVHEVITTKL